MIGTQIQWITRFTGCRCDSAYWPIRRSMGRTFGIAFMAEPRVSMRLLYARMGRHDLNQIPESGAGKGERALRSECSRHPPPVARPQIRGHCTQDATKTPRQMRGV